MSIEAMKQALEYVQEFKRRWWAVPPFGNKVNKATREAVSAAHSPIFQIEDALRAAIEQYDQTSLELCEKCGWKAIIPGEGCLTCARQKAPVAWMYDFLADDRDEIIRDWTTQEYAEIEREKGFNVRPLYPGPRQWIGLTEEETQTLYDRYAVYQEYGAEDSGWFDFARAIEAWLREKNT